MFYLFKFAPMNSEILGIFLVTLEWGFKIYIVYLILKRIPKKEG